jgi:hypothetical protein
MQHTPDTRSAAPDHASELAAALQLIAHGSGDEKVRYIAERDPDWFVSHVLNWDEVDYIDRDETAPPTTRIDRRLLDESIARIALRDRTWPALRVAG